MIPEINILLIEEALVMTEIKVGLEVHHLGEEQLQIMLMLKQIILKSNMKLFRSKFYDKIHFVKN